MKWQAAEHIFFGITKPINKKFSPNPSNSNEVPKTFREDARNIFSGERTF